MIPGVTLELKRRARTLCPRLHRCEETPGEGGEVSPREAQREKRSCPDATSSTHYAFVGDTGRAPRKEDDKHGSARGSMIPATYANGATVLLHDFPAHP